MRKFCFLLCLFVLSLTAWAKEICTLTGFVNSVDLKTQTIVVEDKSYKLSKGVRVIGKNKELALQAVRKGDLVLVTFDRTKKEILEIKIIPKALKE